ncbi:dynein regulatory complex protein 9 [Drosophila miranda]|uniref:dynein regulatory complex protein 9 n=1 Tax=Drosophila miranda TaxID=7229 RepID=UPI0007E7964A|nr:dynein regulatory complex protein 9 [Drosophila miranda]
MPRGYTEEQAEELRRLLLLRSYKDTLDKLVLQQRAQRLTAPKPLSLPASLRRRRSSSMDPKPPPERVLITGKMLPRLETLLGKPEDETDQLDESLLDALKFERDMDALRMVFETAMDQLRPKKEKAEDEEGEKEEMTLDQAISDLSGNNSEESQAVKQLQEATEELKQLNEELEKQKRDCQAKLKDIEERTAETKYNLRCVSRVNDLEYNLVQRWEAGRIAQATIWGENAERAYLRDILDYKQRLAREERVSGELRAFRQQEIVELRQCIKDWQGRYTSDMRHVEREGEAWELRILEQQKLLQRHREVYAERMEFVQEYQAKKDEEQRLLDLQVHRMECAIKLQAWWRGTMVRRGLGPFKKKPKRGKRGKGKK